MPALFLAHMIPVLDNFSVFKAKDIHGDPLPPVAPILENVEKRIVLVREPPHRGDVEPGRFGKRWLNIKTVLKYRDVH